MSEQELKLNVPKSAWRAVERDVLRGAVTRVRLRAQYFDTPDRDLVKAHISLRLRLEGRRWVQTLKMPGAHAIDRVELNHPRPAPVLDLSVYEGTAAGKALNACHEKLAVRYETDVIRLFRRTRVGSSTIEIALDQGHIQAGDLKLPIHEIEFELVSGPVQSLFTLGKRWLLKHSLLLDLRSKAERGDQLAQLHQTLLTTQKQDVAATQAAKAAAVARFWATTTIEPIPLKSGLSCDQAFAIISQACLSQVARNAAVLAEIDTLGICRAGTPEHLHQLRVGLRRLRSAWSLFDGLAHLPEQSLQDDIKQHFTQMGNARDDDVLRESVMPVLNAAGQPPLDLHSSAVDLNGNKLAGSKAFQGWLVDMLAFAVTNGDRPPINPVKLRLALRKRLHKWHQRVVSEGVQFQTLPIESQHRLRKRTKRLRYGLQFAESHLPAAKLKHYRKALAAIQDVLGEMNDLYVARERFERLRDDQPPAWFAVGWIASRLDALSIEAKKAFQTLKRADHFWSN
jgi:inorganic triphosphatase YgiF